MTKFIVCGRRLINASYIAYAEFKTDEKRICCLCVTPKGPNTFLLPAYSWAQWDEFLSALSSSESLVRWSVVRGGLIK